MDNNQTDLTQWIEVQRQASGRLSRGESPELHLHQHHHQAPVVPPPMARIEDPTSIRVPPLVMATYILFLSVALSLPLALIAAIVEAGRAPSVQYLDPSRGGW